MNCCICFLEIDVQKSADGSVIWDQGHNPSPVNQEPDSRCCSDCNAMIVIPARINRMQRGGIQ